MMIVQKNSDDFAKNIFGIGRGERYVVPNTTCNPPIIKIMEIVITIIKIK
jgi:hypothetical protein